MNGEHEPKPTCDEWARALPDLKRRGSEWAGPCPRCGGTDRFHVGTGADGRGLVGCRGCEPADKAGRARWFREVMAAVWPSHHRAGANGGPSPAATRPPAKPKPDKTPMARRVWAAARAADGTPAHRWLAERLAWPPHGCGPALPPFVRWLPRDADPDGIAKRAGALPKGAAGCILFAYRRRPDAPDPDGLLAEPLTAAGGRMDRDDRDRPPRKTIGVRAGAVFEATFEATGDGDHDGSVVLAEGDVSAIAAGWLRPESRVFGAGGTSGLANLDPEALPPGEVLIEADGDKPGRTAAAQAEKRLVAAGRRVQVRYLRDAGDPADALAAEIAARAEKVVGGDRDHRAAWAGFLEHGLEHVEIGPLAMAVDVDEAKGDGLFAAQFIRQHGEDYRYDSRYGVKNGAWVQWVDGTGWRRRNSPPGIAMMKIIREQCDGDKRATEKFDTAPRRAGSLALVAERLHRGEWDDEPYLLGLPKGQVLDLTTGEQRAQRREDYLTRNTGILPADDAGEWPALMLEIGRRDPTWVQYVQALAIDCATGEQGEHMVALAFGKSGTGKDTVFTSILRALGSYATVLPSEHLLVRPSAAHPTWLADLAERRMVLSSEVPAGIPWNAPLVSELTGGGSLTAHFMRQDNFTFTPQFRLVVVCNDLPVLPARAAGLRRRVRVIPFEHDFGVAIDRSVAEYYQSEGRGRVLRWIAEAAAEVHARDPNARYPRCERIENATHAYTGTKPPFDTWAGVHLQRSPQGVVAVAAAHGAYTEWATRTRAPALSVEGFGTALKRWMAPLEKSRPTIAGKREWGYRGWVLSK